MWDLAGQIQLAADLIRLADMPEIRAWTGFLSFTGKDGGFPGSTSWGSLLLVGSTPYGTTSTGGAADNGVVFSLALVPDESHSASDQGPWRQMGSLPTDPAFVQVRHRKAPDQLTSW